MTERKDYSGCKDYWIQYVVHCNQFSFLYCGTVNALHIMHELPCFSLLLLHDISGDIYQLSKRFYGQYMLIVKPQCPKQISIIY